mgnify:CR=1 FL=1
MKKSILILLLFLEQATFSQSNPRSKYPNGFGIQLGGPSYYLSGSYNHFWNCNINTEVGLGILGAYTGVKLFLGNESKKQLLAPYIGGTISYIPPLISRGHQRIIYVPLGIQIMSQNGVHFSVEIAPMLIRDFGEIYELQKSSFIFGGIRIGKNF